MTILILAVGKLRGPEAELCAEYQKRLKRQLSIREIPADVQKTECDRLLDAIPDKSLAILCDEHGKDLASRELAEKLTVWQQRANQTVFIIGGADGVTDELKSRAAFTLSFGRKTWPHRLARVMLCEQLYRALQINAGHPYHRD